MLKVYISDFEAPIGKIKLGSTDKGLAFAALPNESVSAFKARIKKALPECELEENRSQNKDAEQQLIEYFSGSRTKFDLKIDWQGTEFQIKALKKVCAVPFGKTATYKQIAEAINSPNASRAVGMANAKNNLPIIIPCHRIVGSKGLTGYAGGLKLKEKLLNLELSL